MGVHRKTGVYRSIQGCTWEYRGLQEYTWVNMRIQGFIGVYMGEHSKTGVYRVQRVIAVIAWGRLYGGRLYVNYHEVYAQSRHDRVVRHGLA